MRVFILFFYFFIFLFFSTDIVGQGFYPQCKYTSVGVSLKGTYAHGDISGNLKTIRPGIGVNIARRVLPKLTLFSELMWIRLVGEDFNGSDVLTQNQTFSYLRNLHFRNDIKELSFFLQYDLFPSMYHYRKRPTI